jgi:hypothetical protein
LECVREGAEGGALGFYYPDFAIRQRLLQFINLSLGEGGVVVEMQRRFGKVNGEKPKWLDG